MDLSSVPWGLLGPAGSVPLVEGRTCPEDFWCEEHHSTFQLPFSRASVLQASVHHGVILFQSKLK